MISTAETLLGKSLEELTYWVQQQGQPAYRGKQLHQWLYQKGARSLEDISVFPKVLRKKLGNYPVGRSKINYCTISPDATRKYLLSLDDGLIIETVGIPTTKRLTVCVSSQVGCPMTCDFCATGKGGYDRNLKAHEIVDQVLTVQEDFQRRVSHVVFMGMGEPLLNLDAVISAVKILNQDMRIGQRSLTISTVGLPQKIIQLANYHLQVTFAVSLHASNQALREKLIPSAVSYPIKQLLEDCQKYVEITRRRVTFEYILLEGVNDLPYHAIELANHLRGFQSHVNLIPYNPIEKANYKRPNQQKTQTFIDVLKQHKIAVSVRYSRGLKANAACGQLQSSRITSS
ncbi:MAG: 23S rRNA (adenine(2503)-C(2))-methyltransferase RlmN [cyanobacterium endosymbiont of Rhopalodia musculus]|uniref:23S rRNA (adenine(2503)-C(2))-methyltransferase RlmN n=1 Tax=cyanobacterium endosymbiont of Epithemia clementina EcSB TaxID=3034674 RepID=UPI002480F363|nr:23S rRNA (adenine(2503)-C(2))-methyltransferase RlmN [cyanobacterium endosymbiont of Epithemia clementina EcSB]WGT67712.1 23S rRNA (adenine(2503)-C(2))-methyltransferase RlmN [cyanobacterium endosymbiont of Epithemia clementina EcSB]